MKTSWTLLALALLSLSSQSVAQTQRTLGPPEERGAFLYQFHCAGCHGEEGRGDGPVAEFLEVKPIDLTALGKRPQGVSEAWLSMVIDGRQKIRGHGTSRMPVWGMTFARELDGNRQREVEERIDVLAQYVLSIQREKTKGR